MRGPHARAFVLVAVLVAAAGCSDPAAPRALDAPAAASDESGPGTATLRGLVVDENELPVAGAQVEAATASATTDLQGAFLLEGLPMGDLVVTVRAHGFFEAARPARLAPGQALELAFELTRLPIDEPHQRTLILEGFLACNVPGSIYVNENPCPEALRGNAQDRFALPFDPHALAHVLYELDWTSTWPSPASTLIGWLDLQVRAPDDASLAGQKGFEYVRLLAPPDLVIPKDPALAKETHVFVRTPPPNFQGAQNPGDPPAFAQALAGGWAYQQRYTAYVTFAYLAPLADDATFVPDA